MKKDPIFVLSDRVRETAFALQKYHRHGHAEKIYENGLFHRLREQGLKVARQHPVHVCDEDGTVLGEYFADLLVEDQLLLEIRACRSLVDDHVAQLLGCLRSSRREHRLLINFGAPILQVRKYALGDPNPIDL